MATRLQSLRGMKACREFVIVPNIQTCLCRSLLPSTPPLYGGVDGWTWGGGRRIVKKLKKQKNVPVEDTSGRRWTFWHLALRIFAPSNSKTRTLWFATSLFYFAFSVHSPSLAFWCLCSFLFPKATRYQLEPSRRALEGLGFIHK